MYDDHDDINECTELILMKVLHMDGLVEPGGGVWQVW